MGMGFAPTWLRQVSPPPLLHMTTLTTATGKTSVCRGLVHANSAYTWTANHVV